MRVVCPSGAVGGPAGTRPCPLSTEDATRFARLAAISGSSSIAATAHSVSVWRELSPAAAQRLRPVARDILLEQPFSVCPDDETARHTDPLYTLYLGIGEQPRRPPERT